MEEEEGAKIPEIQKYFDVTPDNVRKVFKDFLKTVSLSKLLPNWEGRVPLKESLRNDD